MTSPDLPQKSSVHRWPRRARLLMRDGTMLEGGVFLTDGQALALYLGTRKGGWLNIMQATWLPSGEAHNHVVLQVESIFMAVSLEGDIPVHGSAADAALRDVDIVVEDGAHIRGRLHVSSRQRLADYLFSCGTFIPVVNATRTPSNEPIGDCAINRSAIRLVCDSRVFEAGSMDVAPDAPPDGRVSGPLGDVSLVADAPPPNRAVVRNASGSIQVITEGRVHDRRAGHGAGPQHQEQADAKPKTDDNASAAELTGELQRLPDSLERNWLVRLAAGASLSPPNPRELPDDPSLEDIWAGIARRNDMDETELAMQVAAKFELQLANLAAPSPEALAAIPGRLARRLGLLPLSSDARLIVIATSDPGSLEIDQQLRFVTRKQLRFEVAAPAAIRAAIERHYPPSATP